MSEIVLKPTSSGHTSLLTESGGQNTYHPHMKRMLFLHGIKMSLNVLDLVDIRSQIIFPPSLIVLLVFRNYWGREKIVLPCLVCVLLKIAAHISSSLVNFWEQGLKVSENRNNLKALNSIRD